MTATRRWLTVAGSVAVVLVLDQVSKHWAVDRLKGQAPIDVVWTLRFNYAENTGMAFSKGSGSGRFIALVVVAIVVVLLVVARRMTSWLQLVLVGVVIGGALGNLLDRVFRAGSGFLTGGVVDFIDLQWWPIFNVADAAVVVGGIALALTGLGATDDTAAGGPGAAPDEPVVPATNADVVDEMTAPAPDEPPG
jgi:signal peptidase II